MRRTSQSSAGPTPEVVEDRQPQVAADRAQSIRHGAGDVGALGVAGRVEPMDEERQLLERVVVDVGRDARPFRLRGGDDEVALERGAVREARERADREPAGDNRMTTHNANGATYGLVSVARATSGVTPATAYSVDSRRRPLVGAVPCRRPGWIGPAAARPGMSGIAPSRDPAGWAGPDETLVDGQADPERHRTDGARRDDERDEPALIRIGDPVDETDRQRDHGQRQQDARPAR